VSESNHLLEQFLEKIIVEKGSSRNTIDAYKRDIENFLSVINQKNHSNNNLFL